MTYITNTTKKDKFLGV